MPQGELFNLLQQHGYWVILLISIVEGPIVSLLGGFLSSLGILNLYVVYLLVVLGDFIGDTVYYLAGYVSRDHILDNYGKYIGLSNERLEKLEKIFHRYGGKTLFVGKFLYMIGGFFLVSAGASRMKYGKFIFYNMIGTFIKAALLVGLGYYFGHLYLVVAKYFKRGTEILTLIVIVSFVFVFIFKRILTKYIYKLD